MHRLTCVCVAFALIGTAASSIAAENKVSKLAPDVYFMQTQTEPEFLGCNSGWVIFDDYVLVLDAGFPLSAKIVVEEVRKTTTKPIRYVFDTHYHGDHSFGNGVYTDVGATGVAHTLCIRDQRLKNPAGFQGMMESKDELTRRQVAGAKNKDATIGFDSSMEFSDGKHRVILLHYGQAHTPGDAMAYLPQEKILFTGDACVNGAYNYMGDGDSESWIRVLESLQELDVKTVAPGHGAAAGKELLATQREWFVQLRDRIGAGISAGRSLDQIKADYDIAWYKKWTGKTLSDPSPAANVEQVYNELTGRVTPAVLIRDLAITAGPSPTKETSGWVAPKKVIVPNLAPGKLAALRLVAPNVELVSVRTADEAAKAAADADGVIGFCTADILKAGKKLRWIQVLSAGVENYVTIPELAKSDVVLTNTQKVYAPEIADHALAMLLAFTRGLRSQIPHQINESKWGLPSDFNESQFIELQGKTVLVVGLGGIGTETARRAHAFGVRVIATDPKVTERPKYVHHLGGTSELRSLVGQADAVINCAPLTEETTKMFNADFFAAMKPTAYFISVSRGKLTDTEALASALKNKKIAGAGLDVTEPEPLPPGHELWKMPNVIITPHVASRSEPRDERMWLMYRENLRRFAAGELLLGVVDKAKGY
jgi:phosphoglycerate dehydrogenase-like enzyme/glyoxylase-like metal-dependent hydrolase (beta-lactamase superfamily II)